MELSKELATLLDGRDLYNKQSIAMMLQSVNAEDYPHSAMISVGEIVAIDNTTLRLALWPKTQTTLSLLKRRKANLVIVYNQKVNYIELDVEPLNSNGNSTYDRTYFEATLKSIKEDVAKYATITSGITFKLNEPEEVVQRWETTIKDMKSI